MSFIRGRIEPEQEYEIQSLVEEELQSLLGPRFEHFCYCFAWFCKLDYGLRFFYLVMRTALEDEGLLKNKKNISVKREKLLEHKALRIMVVYTCLVLQRIVQEYGHLVDY